MWLPVHVVAQFDGNNYFDRFNTDTGRWSCVGKYEGGCSIEGGKLNVHVTEGETIVCKALDIIGLENRARTEVSFEFERIGNAKGSIGLVMTNFDNAGELEYVRIFLEGDQLSVIKISNSYSTGNWRLGPDGAFSIEEGPNEMVVGLDNRGDDEEVGAYVTVSLNGAVVFSSSTNRISNFHQIGLLFSREGHFEVDNFLVSQADEIIYQEDAFDYMLEDGSLVIDHNGVSAGELGEFLPEYLQGNFDLLAPNDLVAALKADPAVRGVKVLDEEIEGFVKRKCEFVYRDVIIEFPMSGSKANPLELSFIDVQSMDKFFDLFTEYHSYRSDEDGDRAQWPSASWYAITRNSDLYRVIVWRGF